MDQHLTAVIALIGALGLGSQWLAWRLRLPAIVLLLLSGLVAGPLLGLIEPEKDFGRLLEPFVGIAVAVILFEGGLTLEFEDLRHLAKPVRRLVLLGAPVTWMLSATAAHWLLALSWPVALLFGALLTITGPTVILPLLRQAKLDERPATVLKWEGIVNDPLGALAAYLVLEFVTGGSGSEGWRHIGSAMLGIFAAGAVGFAVGRCFAWAVLKGQIAEFLKGPAILALLLLCYVLGNGLQEEAGLVAVTVLGATLANTELAGIDQMRRLKEYFAVILVSGLFIVLSAELDLSQIRDIDPGVPLFLALLLLVIRPTAVLISTAGGELSWRERLLLSWIAPRGIVVVAAAGLFAALLEQRGYEDATRLVPLAFAVVVTTVVAHGFTIGWLGRRLGLAAGPEHGVLIVGATRWSTELAKAFADAGTPVLLVDASGHRLHAAETAGLDSFHGEILSEKAERDIDFNRFDHLLAASPNDAYNALVCTQFGAELGRERVFQLASHLGGPEPNALRAEAQGQVLLHRELDSDVLEGRLEEGWTFKVETLERARDWEKEERSDKALPVARVKSDGRILLAAADHHFSVEPGEKLILFTPGGKEEEPEPESLAEQVGEEES